MNFKGKKVLIVGMARSGISAAILLKKLGACVIVSDSKTEDKISDEVLMLKAYDISLYLG